MDGNEDLSLTVHETLPHIRTNEFLRFAQPGLVPQSINRRRGKQNFICTAVIKRHDNTPSIPSRGVVLKKRCENAPNKKTDCTK